MKTLTILLGLLLPINAFALSAKEAREQSQKNEIVRVDKCLRESIVLLNAQIVLAVRDGDYEVEYELESKCRLIVVADLLDTYYKELGYETKSPHMWGNPRNYHIKWRKENESSK